jgi:hypothetical protein
VKRVTGCICTVVAALHLKGIEVWHGKVYREMTRTLTFKLPIRLFRLNKRLGKKHYGSVVGEKMMKTALKIPYRTDQALDAH